MIVIIIKMYYYIINNNSSSLYIYIYITKILDDNYAKLNCNKETRIISMANTLNDLLYETASAE